MKFLRCKSGLFLNFDSTSLKLIIETVKTINKTNKSFGIGENHRIYFYSFENKTDNSLLKQILVGGISKANMKYFQCIKIKLLLNFC